MASDDEPYYDIIFSKGSDVFIRNGIEAVSEAEEVVKEK